MWWVSFCQATFIYVRLATITTIQHPNFGQITHHAHIHPVVLYISSAKKYRLRKGHAVFVHMHTFVYSRQVGGGISMTRSLDVVWDGDWTATIGPGPLSRQQRPAKFSLQVVVLGLVEADHTAGRV